MDTLHPTREPPHPTPDPPLRTADTLRPIREHPHPTPEPVRPTRKHFALQHHDPRDSHPRRSGGNQFPDPAEYPAYVHLLTLTPVDSSTSPDSGWSRFARLTMDTLHPTPGIRTPDSGHTSPDSGTTSPDSGTSSPDAGSMVLYNITTHEIITPAKIEAGGTMDAP